MTKEQFNALPRPTFRWMKVNHLELDPLAEKALAPVELASVRKARQRYAPMKATGCRIWGISRVPVRKPWPRPGRVAM